MKIKSSKIVIILVIGIILILMVGAATLFNQQSARKPTIISTPSGNLNVSPSTPEEKKMVDDNKKDLANEKNQTDVTTSGTNIINPVIVDAGQYDSAIEVRAFEPNVVEQDGVCTISFDKDSSHLARTLAAIPDASTTRCPNLSVARNEFASSGYWRVTVAYMSPKTSGIIIKNIEVK